MVSVLSLGVGRPVVTELRDITERVNAEAELSRVWRMLRDAVDNIPNGFAIYGADPRLLLCHASYAPLYGRTPDDMHGSPSGANYLPPRPKRKHSAVPRAALHAL